MSAGTSILGRCEECCVCPEPVLESQFRTAERSMPECGWLVDGTRYLTGTFTRTISTSSSSSNCPEREGLEFFTCESEAHTEEGAFTRTDSYDAETCTLTTTYGGTLETVDLDERYTRASYEDPWGDPCYIRTITFNYTKAADGTCTYTSLDEFEQFPPCGPSTSWSIPGSGTTTTCTVTEDDPVTYSDAYTVAMMVGDALAALELETWADGGSGAYFFLNEAETYVAVSGYRYRFRFKIPVTGTYSLSWVERFTPDVGTVVDTPMSATWDGVVPGGYDPEDPATWPTIPASGYYEIAPPGVNGGTQVVEVVEGCGL